MESSQLLSESKWTEYSAQSDSVVTYFFVGPESVSRLSGESDILYIGKTAQPISKRYRQETRTKNTPRNTQQTNIRTTHIFNRLGLESPRCFYSKSLETELNSTDAAVFLPKLSIWDKQFFLSLTNGYKSGPIVVSFEKLLLVRYVDEHLELPPLNNRM